MPRCFGGVILWVFCLLLAAALPPAAAAQSAAPKLVGVPARAWLRAHGALRVGAFQDYPPFGFRDQQGRMQGIAIDLWRLLARKLEIAVEFHPASLADQLQGLANSRFDSLTGIFPLASRRARFDFSRPYATISTYIWVRSEQQGVAGWAGLDGLLVGAVAGDSGLVLARAHGLKPLVLPGYEQVIQALATGRLQAIVMDEPVVLYWAAQHNQRGRFRRVGTPVDHGRMTLPVAKGNAVLLDILNRGLAAVSKAEYRALEARWLDRPRP